MATIYKFLIEQKAVADSGGRKTAKSGNRATKGAAKKGKYVSIFGGEKGGVEHNRKSRVINPLINKATGGAWEKGLRAGRAAAGLIQENTETGKYAISGTALAILIQMVLLGLLKWQEFERDKATKMNEQNYKQLENGIGGIHGAYEVSTHILTGRQTYNQNK